MHSRNRRRWWFATTATSVVCLSATTLTAYAADSSAASDASGASKPSVMQQNSDWGRALPPADAPTSRAYDLIVEDNDKGYTPQPGECSKEIHAHYWTYGPDGKVYPTWHPARDPSGCTFGHEHGDDPRRSDLFDRAGWPAFGYTSEVMLETKPEAGQRHEDHVGHKVIAADNINVIQGDDGTSFFPPQGTVIAQCSVLLKFHQGTHSPDAFTNNVHELIYHSTCRFNSGQTTEVRYTGMIPNGRPGGFGATDCPGPFGSRFTQVGPATPADSPADTRTLGRLITDERCVQAIRDGLTHFEPITGTFIPFDTNDLHEFWFADVRVNGAGVNFNLQPLFYVLNPSRYYDASKPDGIARQVDLCYQGIRGQFCDQVRSITQQTGQTVTWNDPRSPFKGGLREYRPGMFTLQSNGPTTIYTDVYGQNASTTPFEGSVEQYFSGSTPSQVYLRGVTRDWAANPADRVHAPN